MKNLILAFVLFVTPCIAYGQGEVELRNDGIVIPSLTTTERNTISAPEDGHIIYNETTDQVEIRQNGSWVSLSSGSPAGWKIEDLLDQNTGVYAVDGVSDYVQLAVEGNASIYVRRNAHGDLRLDFSNATGVTNTFVGNSAGLDNDPASGATSNTFLGYNAGRFNTEGHSNTLIGRAAGYENTTGIDNTIVGRSAGFQNKGGSRNTFIGRRSGYDSNENDNPSNDNTYVGHRSGTASNSSNNTFVGSFAGEHNGSFNNSNVFMGYESGRNPVSGTASYNVAIGNASGQYITKGNNVMIGHEAGQNVDQEMGGGINTQDNVIIGYQAGKKNTFCCNTYLGKQSGTNNKGSGNVFIGNNSGGTLTTTSNKLYIDNSSTSTPLIYGDFSTNRVGINNNDPDYALDVSGVVNATTVACNGTSVCSDYRLKKNFEKLSDVLSLIMQLDGYYHDWRVNEFEDFGFTDRRQIGFVAQEVKSVFPELIEERKDGYLMVDYSKMTAVLVQAIKEQQFIIENQQKMFEKLNKESQGMDDRMKELEARLSNVAGLVSE